MISVISPILRWNSKHSHFFHSYRDAAVHRSRRNGQRSTSRRSCRKQTWTDRV